MRRSPRCRQRDRAFNCRGRGRPLSGRPAYCRARANSRFPAARCAASLSARSRIHGGCSHARRPSFPKHFSKLLVRLGKVPCLKLLRHCLPLSYCFAALPAAAATDGLVRGTILVNNKPEAGVNVALTGEGSLLTTKTDAPAITSSPQVPFGDYMLSASYPPAYPKRSCRLPSHPIRS